MAENRLCALPPGGYILHVENVFFSVYRAPTYRSQNEFMWHPHMSFPTSVQELMSRMNFGTVLSIMFFLYSQSRFLLPPFCMFHRTLHTFVNVQNPSVSFLYLTCWVLILTLDSEKAELLRRQYCSVLTRDNGVIPDCPQIVGALGRVLGMSES